MNFAAATIPRLLIPQISKVMIERVRGNLLATKISFKSKKTKNY